MNTTKPRGGARPKRRTDDARSNNGGARSFSGPIVRNVELSMEDAKSVRILLSNRGIKPDKEAVLHYISGLIRERWQAYDEQVQAIAETYEGIV